MSSNTLPTFPASPAIGIASLTSATPVTSRANIAATAGLTQLTATSTNGTRVDAITVSGKGTTVASTVDVWMFNGTTSFYLTSIDVSAVTASNTVDPFTATKTFSTLVLPPTYQLYISQTVQTDLNVFAFGGVY